LCLYCNDIPVNENNAKFTHTHAKALDIWLNCSLGVYSAVRVLLLLYIRRGDTRKL